MLDVPSPHRSSEITRVINEMAAGDAEAMGRLLPLIYDDLRRLAQVQLGQERPGHTLQATALVHEAYLRLVRNDGVQWTGKSHFLGAAAETIRRILVDHARAKRAAKRGGNANRIELDTSHVLPQQSVIDVLALDEAINDLAALSETQSKIVVLRVFGGMTNPEAAEALGMKLRTLEGDWSMAKQWLRARLEKDRS